MPYKDKEARSAYNRAYHAANRERNVTNMRAWHSANRDKVGQAKRQWRAANPPSINPRHAYAHHKATAKRRGIAFLLTFEEWMAIWLESQRWEQRGNLKGQYVMARTGDAGAYECGNVRICSVSDNRIEARQGKPMGAETRQRISDAMKKRHAEGHYLRPPGRTSKRGLPTAQGSSVNASIRIRTDLPENLKSISPPCSTVYSPVSNSDALS